MIEMWIVNFENEIFKRNSCDKNYKFIEVYDQFKNWNTFVTKHEPKFNTFLILRMPTTQNYDVVTWSDLETLKKKKSKKRELWGEQLACYE